MASGSAVGGEGGNDGPKEKPRYSESKVYTRKSFKGLRNNLTNNSNTKETTANGTTLTTAGTTTATAPTSATTNQNGSNENKAADGGSIKVSEPLALVLEDTSSAQSQLQSEPEPEPRDDNSIHVSESQALVSENADSAKPQIAASVSVSEPQALLSEDIGSTLPGCGLNEVSEPQVLVSADTGSTQRTPDGESIRVSEPQASVLEHLDSAHPPDGASIEDPQTQVLMSEVTESAQPQQQQEQYPLQPPQKQHQLPGLGQEKEQQGDQVHEQLGSPKQPEPQEQQGELSQELSGQQKQPEQQEPPPLPPPLRVDVISDDSSNHQRQQVDAAAGLQGEEDPASNSAGKEVLESRIKINLASVSKQEMREIRRKLQNELNTVKMLVKRIEAKQSQLGVATISSSVPLRHSVLDSRLTRVNSNVGSVGVPREVTATVTTPTPRQTRPLHQLSVSVLENNQGAAENVEKEKRTPKANQFYRNSEFLLAKDKFPPAESNKKSKSSSKKHGSDMAFRFGSNTKIFRNCSSVLDKLMKHKHGWVFNSPVDVEGLRLHDYHTIIKHPMDLGTVKARLNKNWYKSPEEFAEDVRLTFHNAMTYNPKGQDVHIMAEQLLTMFEERWAVVKVDYDRETRLVPYDIGFPTPTSRKIPSLSLPSLDMRRILDRSESMTYPSVDIRQRPVVTTPSGRTPAPKKPKAKDLHKRDMTYEEKQKLSTNLQSLPSDKLDNIVQIIKKRNSALLQRDDEIEVDIDSVDAETLWELDRFVTNYKKSLSKNKRKAELAMQARTEVERNVQQKQALLSSAADPPKEANEGERNVSNVSPVQVDRQADNGSRSSSSSSSSSGSGSSSSDSDSDSSSASGS
ncbi:unnamed protein product [Linum tenue]|uniref:Transcription factor GTE4-like n=1 Tax=Linum tenue TaxID=586396 RepID=A0AAV0MRX4_9ROSI|nr:unnamed protein product [Linum tenue]CAI0449062.1 unnamed protein product [Linum tenue]